MVALIVCVAVGLTACDQQAAPPPTTLAPLPDEPLVIVDGVEQVQGAAPSTTVPAVVVTSADSARPDAIPVAEGTPVEGDQAQALFDELPAFESTGAGSADDGTATTTPPPTESRPVPLPNTISDVRLPSSAAAIPTDESATKPLTVERYQPEGDVSSAKFVTVTFSEPMVTRVTGTNLSADASPASITPDVEGNWRWIGTRTLRFQPVGAALPGATDYKVTVRPGISSVAGTVLASEVTWNLTTPPPSIIDTINASADEDAPSDLLRDAVFVVRFDQLVDPAPVIATVLMSVDGQLVPVRQATASEIASDPAASAAIKSMPEGRWIAFRGVEPLPAAADVTITVGPGVPSAEGSLVSDTMTTLHATTFGAFEVESSACGQQELCRPGDAFTIALTNPIDGSAFSADQITISPAIADLRIEVADNSIALSGGTSGRTDYTIALDPSLTDLFGQQLGATRPITFSVSDADPQFIGFPSPFVTVDPKRAPGLTVQSINQTSLKVTAWVVDPAELDGFYSFAEATARGDVEADPGWPVVFERTIDVDAEPNQFATTTIELADAFNLAGSQIAVRVVPENLPPPGSALFARNRPTVTWAQSTTLGIDAIADSQQLLIWVTDLSDGTPVAHASVELVGDGRVATTDEDGLAKVPLDESGDTTGIAGLYASTNNRVAFLPGIKDTGWRANPSPVADRWFVTGARSVFRPDVVAEFVGWLRQLRAGEGVELSNPGAGVGEFRALDSAGEEIAAGEFDLDDNGAFDVKFIVPAEVAEGTATLSLSLAGGDSYDYRFEIATFQPSPFEVRIDPAETDHVSVSADETISLTASAAGPGGAPVPDAPIDWAVESTIASVTPPGWEDFVFGQPLNTSSGPATAPIDDPAAGLDAAACADCETDSDLVAVTDITGRHRIELNLPPTGEAVTLTATATVKTTAADATTATPAGASASARTRVTVYPSETFVGLRVDEPILAPGDDLLVTAVTTDLEGELTDSESTRVTVVRAEPGSPTGTSADNPTPSQPCELEPPQPDGTSSCSVILAAPGLYHVLAVTTDRQGRTSTTETNAYVVGRNAIASPAQLGQRPNVELVADRNSYAPGDTARVLVRAPVSSGFGIAVVSNGTIRHVVPFELEGSGAIIEVPIDDVPNVGVDVDVVGRPTDPAAPSVISSGSIDLAVPPSDKALQLDVTIGASTPGNGQAEVSVTDASGDPVADADVTLLVIDADAGTPATLPDLLTTMWAPIAHQLGTQATRDAVALGTATPTNATWILDENDVGNTPAQPSSSDTPPGPPVDSVVGVVSGLVTDSDGLVTSSVPLSPEIGKFQVVAYAAGGVDRFGSARSEVESSTALRVRPLTPPVATVGDRVELPVRIDNGDDQDAVVDVGLQLGRALLLDGVSPGDDGVSQIVRRVTVPAQSSLEVRFPVTPSDVGQARLRAIASADGTVSTSQATLTIRPKGPDVSDAIVAPLLGGSIAYPVNVSAGSGTVEVSMSPTVVIALTDAVIAASADPAAGGTSISIDVLASRLRVITDTLKDRSQFASAEVPSPEQAELTMAQLVTQLAVAQLADGTWPTWTEPASPRAEVDASPPTTTAVGDAWATLSAMRALLQAEAAGAAVPADTLARAEAAVPTVGQLLPADATVETTSIVTAYVLALRAQLGDDVVAEAATMADAEVLPIEAAATLLPIVTDADARSKLLKRLTGNISVRDGVALINIGDGGDGFLTNASTARAMATALEALVISEPGDASIGPLLSGLIDQQQAGHWTTGSADAAATRAILLYADRVEPAIPPAPEVPASAPEPSSDSSDSSSVPPAGDEAVADPNVAVTSRAWVSNSQIGELRARQDTVPSVNAVPVADVVADVDGLTYATIETSAPIWYRISLRRPFADADMAPADDGFIIERRYSAVTEADSVVGDETNSWTIDNGALVRVDVTVVTEADRHNVLITDWLPAGLSTLATLDPPTAWFDDHQLVAGGSVVTVRHLAPGTYEFSYLAQASATGAFTVPGALVSELGIDGATGRSAAAQVTVS